MTIDTHNPQVLLFLLIAGHHICDFALQNEFVATNKNRHARNQFTVDERNKMLSIWPHLLTAHAIMHGTAVFLITQNLTLGILETVAHWITDFLKCEGKFNFHTDQFIHLAFKGLWAYLYLNNIV